MMKSFYRICFAVLTLSLLHCKKNNVDPDGLDPIIGNWHLLSFATIDNGVEVKDELSSCEQKTQLVLSAEGTIASTSYTDDSDEGCIVEDKTEGTWKSLGGGVYQLTISGEIISEEISLKADLLSIRDEIKEEQLTYITVLNRTD